MSLRAIFYLKIAFFQKSIDFRQSPIFVILSVAKNPRIYGEMP